MCLYGTLLDGQRSRTTLIVDSSLVSSRTTPIVDADHDGLIEINDATMLDNMRYDLTGTSYKTSASDVGSVGGCPDGACHGYELTGNIDLLSFLDKDEDGMIDTTTTVTVAGKVLR